MLETDSTLIWGMVKPVINYINSLITRLVPQMQVPFLIALSLMLAYLIKQKNNWNNYGFVGSALALFGFFRYIGLG